MRQDKNILPPAIQPGGLYFRQQLIENGISRNKLEKWQDLPEEEGLFPRETETNGFIYVADEVIEFVKRLPKLKARKKAGG